MTSSHHEMASILGLENFPDTPLLDKRNEWWDVFSGLKSLKKRQDQYSPLSPLNVKHLNFFAKKQYNPLTVHGSYIGFLSFWFKPEFRKFSPNGHAYSIHIIQDRDKTHCIYVNRGAQHYGVRNENDAPNVRVFTKDHHEAVSFVQELFNATSSIHPCKAMSKFLSKYESSQNTELMEVLSKKSQKTGNCVAANSNIALHYQLASEYMQLIGCDFAEAYTRAKVDYKTLRCNDRAQAFQYLLNDRLNYSKDRYFLYNFFQVLVKFYFKGPEFIRNIINRLEINQLPSLTSILESDTFLEDVDNYIQDRIKQYRKSHPVLTERSIKEYTAQVIDVLLETKNSILEQSRERLTEHERHTDLLSP